MFHLGEHIVIEVYVRVWYSGCVTWHAHIWHEWFNLQPWEAYLTISNANLHGNVTPYRQCDDVIRQCDDVIRQRDDMIRQCDDVIRRYHVSHVLRTACDLGSHHITWGHITCIKGREREKREGSHHIAYSRQAEKQTPRFAIGTIAPVLLVLTNR